MAFEVFEKNLRKAVDQETQLHTLDSPLPAKFQALPGPSTLHKSRRVTTHSAQVAGEVEPRRARFQMVSDEQGWNWEEVDSSISTKAFSKKRFGNAPLKSTESESSIVIDFDRLSVNDVSAFLEARDRDLTPHRGLRRWNPNSRKLEDASPPRSGKMVLVMHGTFSNSDRFFRSLVQSEHGSNLLEFLEKHYRRAIFTFDHPTLSVGPILNAIDLQRALGTSKAKIDLIAHSRGGLVSRWYTELFDPLGTTCRRVICVGSPLAGTGLASPHQLRIALRQLTNYGWALSEATRLASMAIPVLSVMEVLLQVSTAMTSLGSKLPVVDAGVALIPGLFGQSRVANNPEILRLRQSPRWKDERFFAVTSNFESQRIGWRFWRSFRKDYWLDKASNALFESDNDLVVDTASMSHLHDRYLIPKSRRLDFGTNDRVHHVNYFDFAETTNFIVKSLSVV